MVFGVSSNGFVKVEVKKEEMLPGYIQTIDRLSQVKESMKVVGGLSFGLTLGSIFLTRIHPRFSSVVIGTSSFLYGSVYCTSKFYQCQKVERYTGWSMALQGENGPSCSARVNQEIARVFASGKAKISIKDQKIIIIGPKGDLEDLTEKQRLIQKIQTMDVFKIPDFLLDSKTKDLSDQTIDRWWARAMTPLAIVNLLVAAILLMDGSSKKLNLDDLAVILSSGFIIVDYFSGKSVQEVRDELSQYLKIASTSELFLRKVISPEMIESGSMSFLKVFEKEKELAIRVGVFGTFSIHTKAKALPFFDIACYPKERFVFSTKNEK